MRVVLPNGIVIHPETGAETEQVVRWLMSAPDAVLSYDHRASSLQVSPPPPAVEKSEVIDAGDVTKPAEMGSGLATWEADPESGSDDPADPPARPSKTRTSTFRRGTDLTGQVIEGWTVLELAEKDRHGNRRWRCRHSCGGTHEILGFDLRRGHAPKTCPACRKNAREMKPSPRNETEPEKRNKPSASQVRLATEEERSAPPRNPRLTGISTLVGLTFGTWKVVSRSGGGDGKSYWRCVCRKCGSHKDHAALGAHGLRNNPPACGACRMRTSGKSKEADEDQEEATG